MAPFFSDVDIRRDGNVFYNVYTNKDSSYIERATQDARLFSGDDSFTAKWVLVATWDRVPNYPDGSLVFSDKLSNRVKNSYVLLSFVVISVGLVVDYYCLLLFQRNTFQVVIVTDGEQSFALFNYPSDGLQWSGRGSPAVVGYTTRDANFFARHYLSGFHEVVDIATQRLSSNVRTTGRLFYQLSGDSNLCAGNSICLNWYFNDIVQDSSWTDSIPPCPCSLFQAITDRRYRWDTTTETSLCLVATFPSFASAQTECCYSFSGELLVGSPQGGTANRYHSFFLPFLHFLFDTQPYQDCCVNADLCRLYYLRRPSRSCVGYFPPFFGERTCMAWYVLLILYLMFVSLVLG